MTPPPTRYAVLRDRRAWEGAWIGLQVGPDGALELARVPGPADGRAVVLPDPYEVAASGLALGACREVYLVDGVEARLVALDEVCRTRRELPGSGGPGDGPGELRLPRALLFLGDRLYLADAGNGRVLRYRLPRLELAGIFGPPLLVQPSGLVGDGEDRVYVLDTGLRRVLRFRGWGTPDQAYNQALVAAGKLDDPVFLATAGDPEQGDVLYVADAAAEAVLRFGPDGGFLGALPAGGPARPRALVAAQGRMYVADAADGRLWVHDLAAAAWTGVVDGYRGPVAALALDASGDLLLKPGQGEPLIRLTADAGCVATGRLAAGPLDAGLDAGWGRVAVRAEVPGMGLDRPARARLWLYTADAADLPPGPDDWTEAPSLDTLAPRERPDARALARTATLGPAQPAALRPRRHLWLRLDLTSADGRTSPRVHQVQAETAGPGYLGELPEIYRRADEEGDQPGFLHDWLELIRSVLGDLDAVLDAMPRRFDPAVAPDDHLPWLASWLALTPPAGMAPDDLRALLARVPDLYRRLGTPAGLRELIRIEAGAHVQLVEAFHERRIWRLGMTSVLGVDTALAPANPSGLVVAEDDAGLAVGGITVGRGGPLPADQWATPLFAETAFRFRVVVPAGELAGPSQRDRLRAVVERERPAYTDWHLCVVEPRMRVGVQARLGVDAMVAGPSEPLPLSEAVLGTSTVLGEDDAEPRVGRDIYVG